jgi:hypothetical protein
MPGLLFTLSITMLFEHAYVWKCFGLPSGVIMTTADKSKDREHPYSNLPPSQYWRTGVAESHIMDMDGLYTPKFTINQYDKVAVAGSCFAQHVGRNLTARGFTVLDTEPTPDFLTEAVARKYGYGIYSARYGNIYSPRQLLQLIRDCGKNAVRADDFWFRDGKVYDALRPNVEPDGLETITEAIQHRSQHLSAVRELFQFTDVMIFTLGLTEAWMNRKTGTIYPTCPGVIAGEFDEKKYAFVNFDFNEAMSDMIQVRKLLKAINPAMKFLLTVSPVPLTATASGKHVLVATTYSKSVLRAVCGSMCDTFGDVDYFPSYELIASPAARGFFYEPNMRSINGNGVAHVMSLFLKAHANETTVAAEESIEIKVENPRKRARERRNATQRTGQVVCEEELLEAFAK